MISARLLVDILFFSGGMNKEKKIKSGPILEVPLFYWARSCSLALDLQIARTK